MHSIYCETVNISDMKYFDMMQPWHTKVLRVQGQKVNSVY